MLKLAVSLRLDAQLGQEADRTRVPGSGPRVSAFLNKCFREDVLHEKSCRHVELFTNRELSVFAKWHSHSMWNRKVGRKKNKEALLWLHWVGHQLSHGRKCLCWESREDRSRRSRLILNKIQADCLLNALIFCPSDFILGQFLTTVVNV